MDDSVSQTTKGFEGYYELNVKNSRSFYELARDLLIYYVAGLGLVCGVQLLLSTTGYKR